MGGSGSKDSITAASTADDVARISGVDLTGKVYIVTGTTSGIGREAARVIAKYKGTLICANRNKESSAKTVDELKAETKNDNIHSLHIDLTKFASIQKFVQDFEALGLPLHGLLNNAGMVNQAGVKADVYEETEDGHDIMYQVNYLGGFFLTHLLKEKLVASAPSRVVNVSSIIHSWTKDEFFPGNYPMTKETWDRMQSYACAKLYQVLHAEHLNEQLKDSGVTAYSVHPGAIFTNIYTNTGALKYLMRVLNMAGFIKSVELGASTSIYCLLTDAALEHSGKYFDDNAVQTNPKKIYKLNSDKDAQKQVWELSMKAVEEFLAKNKNGQEQSKM